MEEASGETVETTVPAPVPTVPWNQDLNSDLAKQVRRTTESHLNTYADPNRLAEDVRHETGVLEAAYRHRQVIELIQNGADALIGSAGGRIEVRLDAGVLYVANEGAPLSDVGLNSLLYFNLAAKKGKEIGRLGVGFKSVLELTDSPYFLSRSLSLSFDRERTIQMLAERLDYTVAKVPVMRFAEPIDPFALVSGFPALDDLLQWASTVVVLPLKPGTLDWLARTLRAKDLRDEFLLFSPHVSSITIDDRENGSERIVLLTRDGGDLMLTGDDDSEPSRWRLRSRTVQLSDEARHDGGERFERPEVDLAWALPLDETSRVREIWAFFPVTGVASTLPGVLNSAWKLSEDRSNLVEGPFNEFLLDRAAELVVDSITEHLPEDRPGLALELLPAPPDDRRGWSTGSGWVGDRIQRSTWSEARRRPIMPAADGSWRHAGLVALWPEWIRRPGMVPIRTAWLDAVADPAGWVHPSVMTEERVRRAKVLGVRIPSVTSWVEAVRDPDQPLQSSKAALSLAAMIWDRDEAIEQRSQLLEARVVWTEAGEWAQIAACRFDDDAPPDTAPAAGTRQLVRDLHRVAGIAGDVGERLIVELATRAARGASLGDDTGAFWDAVHGIGAKRTLGVLGQFGSLSNIPVRTGGGAFRAAQAVLMPGDLLDLGTDADLCVDLSFHSADRLLLERLGVEAAPGWDQADDSSDSSFGQYARECERKWRDVLRGRGRGMPQWGYGFVEPVDSAASGGRRVPTHQHLFREASGEGRLRLTQHVMSSE
ncbi:MAG: sacsin N-terminal ATP-binding-like domain-containing protein, partial [Microthrixaceae bacterium]